MSTLAVIPATQFVSPTSQAALGGAMGLTLHDIAKSLGARFSDVKKKLLDRDMISRLHRLGFTVVLSATSIESLNFLQPTREIETGTFCVGAAKFFLAKYENDIGDAYLSHLIACEGKAETLDSLLSNPANAAKVFQALADQRIALDAMKAIAAHALGALTSSQQNTGAQTRRVHALEAKLLQLDRMMSLAQFFVVSNLKPQHEAASYTLKVRVLLEALGHVPVRQTLANDKWPSWTFKKSWLTDNHDRIAAVVVEVDAAKTLAKPKPRNVCSIPPNA